MILSALLTFLPLSGVSDTATSMRVATPAEIERFFESQGKRVVTFIGYSGTGYEDPEAMLSRAREVLEEHDPAEAIVNAGATPDGIGAVYELAKSLGFTTTGIVSTQAREYDVEVSPYVDHVFFVEDETWGGFLEDSDDLSPTSTVMVAVSDTIIGIGGGEVGRDEMIAARRLGRPVTFIPADMNHEKAKEKARKKGEPAPSDYRGPAHEALAGTRGP